MGDVKGLTTAKLKGKGLPPIVMKPVQPENLHLSRDEYIRREQIRKEREAKIKAYTESLDSACNENPIVEPSPIPVNDKPEEVKISKPRGRPKKIE